MLRLDPWSPQQRVSLAPALPPSIRRLHAAGISIGDAELSIDIDGDHVEVSRPDGYDIVPMARPPLSSLFDE